jgi:hypothetical protein
VSQSIHESEELLVLRGDICLVVNIEHDFSSFARAIYNSGRVSKIRDRARLYEGKKSVHYPRSQANQECQLQLCR